jgi:oligopeptide/dipeptide ABC transporter ATP-binding protein
MTQPLLEIKDLAVYFDVPEGVARAVDGVSFHVSPGETLALVGESGCGKSVTSLSVLGLIPSPPGRIERGRIIYGGRNLLAEKEESLRKIRGNEISMIFQEPMTSLNPVLSIGRQVAEPLMVHRGLGRQEATAEALSWLERVRIPAAARRLEDYPHQLSGGMRQRVMIAMALVCHPRLLIADEPTTALDVTIQAQVLTLMQSLKDELGMALMLITHDLGVVAQVARRVVVMYAGQVVEEAPVADIFDRPFHPYTQGLLKSMPRLGQNKGRLAEIAGTVPVLTEKIAGCRFAARCVHHFDRCRIEAPPLFEIGESRQARCWLKRYPDRRKAHV